MKCRNFLCDDHDIEAPDRCRKWLNIRHCDTRKKYNRIMNQHPAYIICKLFQEQKKAQKGASG